MSWYVYLLVIFQPELWSFFSFFLKSLLIITYLKFHMSTDSKIVLQLLAVHPSHQGKGVGTLLLQEGLRQADELGVPVWLEASEKGRPLYRKFGFNDFKTIEIDLAEWGGEGIDRHVCMLRDVHIES
jgi:GNAT superfamily N-acetyltransferase